MLRFAEHKISRDVYLALCVHCAAVSLQHKYEDVVFYCMQPIKKNFSTGAYFAVLCAGILNGISLM
jgi:hypothetical protein